MIVFDTETRTDATQSLTFGSYRFIEDGLCLEEGLFYGEGLTKKEHFALREYVATHKPATDPERGITQLLLLSREEFLEKFYTAAFDARALVVGFNLPFDLSRLAISATGAGQKNKDKRFLGGFSFVFWEYEKDGVRRANKYRPRIAIKHIDSKRSLKAFTAALGADTVDLIPDEMQAEGKRNFRGNFLDLRTLAFVLTDRGHTLASACEAFGISNAKMVVEEHGTITREYIDYNRQDVNASVQLADKMLEEYDKFDVNLQVTKAYSPASLGKAHLRAMNIPPILERQAEFPKKFLGYAQSAFYGGRTSAHIRKVPVPVVYVDFLSMYPTVNALMGLWSFVIAKDIDVDTNCLEEILEFLQSVTVDSMFNPETWSSLAAFVRVVPNGDVLPTRAVYSRQSNDWQVGINHLYAGEAQNDSLWYALPDVVASILLTGRIPEILEAFRIVPNGQLVDLKPVSLRGMVRVDPARQDFFRTVIEQRKRYANDKSLPKVESDRLDIALKVLANATSYGIFAEMNRHESDREEKVTCFGIDATLYTANVKHPEEPGEYCFPPLASLITAGARLMLALLERCVTDLGGTYAMEDTDSMAIVATQRGGLVSCAGGPQRDPAGNESVKALSWNQVQQLSNRFRTLNPHDPAAISTSVLEIEVDNLEPESKNQRQLWCYAISAKRYALFVRDEAGEPVLLQHGVNNKKDRWSRHGLGHLLNPIDTVANDQNWIAQTWLGLIRKSLGLTTTELSFVNVPAVRQVTISSPAVMKALQRLNEGRPYREQIKPFNFMLACHIKPFGQPIGTDPYHFHLIAPYEKKSDRWLMMSWTDQYGSGESYRITTKGHHGMRGVARLKAYADVLREYEYHPESKCADADASASGRKSVGLLRRRSVHIKSIRFIGKESNFVEDNSMDARVDARFIYCEYEDPRRDEWETEILPKLRKMPLPELQRRSGLSRSALQAIRAGRRPHPRNRDILMRVVCRLSATDSLGRTIRGFLPEP